MLSLLSVFAFKDSQVGVIQPTTTLPFFSFHTDILCDYPSLFLSLRRYGRNQKTNVTLKFKRPGTILAFVGSIYYLGTCMEHAARLLQPVQLDLQDVPKQSRNIIRCNAFKFTNRGMKVSVVRPFQFCHR